jgi:hypothetical protein
LAPSPRKGAKMREKPGVAGAALKATERGVSWGRPGRLHVGWGYVPRRSSILGVRLGYVAWRWVWLNAAAKSRVSRLEAPPRSLPSGS